MKRWYKFREDKKTFVYIDESGFDPRTERTHGWALKGQKIYGMRSGNRRPRTSLIAANINNSLQAPFLFEGTCNTNFFNAWLEQILCPLLNENCVVVMDNATFHKSKATKELIKNTGATLLFLPPYSPELNPIEHDFANLKRLRQYNQNSTLDSIVNMYR